MFRRACFAVAFLIVLTLNAWILFHRRHTTASTFKETAAKQARAWNDVKTLLLENNYSIQNKDAAGRQFQLRLKLQPEQIAEHTSSQVITDVVTTLPDGGAQEFRMIAESVTQMVTCSPDASSATFQTVTTPSWALSSNTFDGAHLTRIPLVDETEFAVTPLNETTVHSKKVSIGHHRVSSRVYGTTGFEFPQQPVAVGETWSRTTDTSPDFPQPVLERPPTSRATLEKLATFEGKECAFISFNSTYYVSSSLDGDSPDLQFIIAHGRVYAELETGDSLWSETVATCEQTGTKSVTRMAAVQP